MRIEHRDSPDAEFRFFVYCPNAGKFTYYRRAEDRDQGAKAVIQRYMDDGWDETVKRVVAGELTHVCQEVGHEDRPAEAELDAEQRDRAGRYWGAWDYLCSYDLLPLVPVEAQA